ncbi:MAG TPA: PLP-dependent lyase/thiolase [Candidatus Paceibacterota bacterium]|nr:PLP-dependent lyase/thiolase [Candidatus Paceibacterota bacterium]
MKTPQTEAPEIAKELGLDRLYFKREDLHPYGSHKGRSIPVMIDLKIAEGKKDFAISSSGNAALAAVRHIQERNVNGDGLTLSILVGEKMNPAKRKALMDEIKDPAITIEETPRPLQALFRLIQGGGKESLRQSTDDAALVGYTELAMEMDATPGLSAVFIGTSSGTTAEALAKHFIERWQKDDKDGAGPVPQVHIVQTSGNSPLAREFSAEESEPEISLADAIVDKAVNRKGAVVEAIKGTGGTGWIVSNADIARAIALLKKEGIAATANGALGLAGLIRAINKGAHFRGSVVCIVTGK